MEKVESNFIKKFTKQAFFSKVLFIRIRSWTWFYFLSNLFLFSDFQSTLAILSFKVFKTNFFNSRQSHAPKGEAIQTGSDIRKKIFSTLPLVDPLNSEAISMGMLPESNFECHVDFQFLFLREVRFESSTSGLFHPRRIINFGLIIHQNRLPSK